MSTETLQWLNENVLVGFTEQRGNAWHYRASEAGTEPNHYPQAIPADDVRRRLFSWKAQAMPMFVRPDGHDEVEVPNRVAIVRDDTYAVLGVPSAAYRPHQYDEVLLGAVESILDDNLNIGSAGLLKGGAVAWVQVEMPENQHVADIEFRPHLLATTSFNGSIATTYKRTVTVVVCDNTRAIALREAGARYSIRHTANSHLHINSAREALQVVFDLGEAFRAEVTELLEIEISDRRFEAFVRSDLLPLRLDPSEQAKTRHDRQVAQYLDLWKNDHRVAPWRNTAYGALQAVNTYRHHLRDTRGGTLRPERNMLDALTGTTEQADRLALAKLLARA